MNSELMKLNWKDLAKGLTVSIIVVVIGSLQQGFMEHGLNLAEFDWKSILDVAWKAGLGYMTKNFFSDKEGKVLGKIG